MQKYKVGNKVRVLSDIYNSFRPGEIQTVVKVGGSDNDCVYLRKNGVNHIMLDDEIELLTKNNKMNKNKTIKKKAQWKIGDVVYNDYNSQKSKVLAVAWDAEDEMYKYTLQCLDDSGSLHLIYEESISEVEVVKMTVSELKEYYEESENCEVTITK